MAVLVATPCAALLLVPTISPPGLSMIAGLFAEVERHGMRLLPRDHTDVAGGYRDDAA